MKTDSSITVIFFDAAGTLFHVKGSVADVYLQYAEKYGVQASSDLKREINQAFEQAFRDAPPPIFAVDRPEKLKQCERLWWFDIVHAVFYRVGMFDGFDAYFEDVYEAFSTGKHWVLYPETLSVLQYLKSKGYEIGIISNFDTRLFSILRDLNIQQYVDSVTISTLVQAAKPAPKIFEHALSQHVIEPGEAIHVGDSVQDDWEGARGAGLTAIVVSRNETHSPGVDSIQSLEGLPPFLEKIPLV